jgi:hypothetical protein
LEAKGQSFDKKNDVLTGRFYLFGLLPGILLFLLFLVYYHYPSKNPLQKGFAVDVYTADNPSTFAENTTGTNGRMNSRTHIGLKHIDVHAVFKAWLRTEVPGDYGFSLHGYDSANLRIAGSTLLNVSGVPSKQGQYYFFPGFHEITIEFKNRNRPAYIDLKWQPPGSDRYRPIPLSFLYAEYPEPEDLKAENAFLTRYILLAWSCILLAIMATILYAKNNGTSRLKPMIRVSIAFFIFLFLLHTPFLGYDHQWGFRWLVNMSAPARIVLCLTVFGVLSGWLNPFFNTVKRMFFKRPRLRFAAGVIAVVSGVAGQSFFLLAPPISSYFLPVLMYCLCAGVIILTGFRPESVKKPAVASIKGKTKLFYVCVAIVLFWAFWVRFYRIHEIPPGFWWDEAQTGRVVRDILKQNYPPIYDLRINAGTAASYANALWCYLLGSTEPWTLRTWTGCVGVLTVVASWWFFRQLFTPWWSLFGMALMAGSRWLFSINRIAMAMIDETILVTVLILIVYIKAMRKNRLLDHIIAGALTGLSMHLHTGARVLPLVIGLDMLIRLLRFNSRVWKKRLLNSAVLTVFAVSVFAPMAMYIFENFDSYMKRSRETLLSTEYPGWYPVGPYLKNTGYYVEMYAYRGDWHPRHNYQRNPQLAAAVSVLTALGLFLSLRHVGKHPVYRLLFLTFVLTSMQGIATVHLDSANLNRVAINIPIVSAWAVFGAVFICRGFKAFLKGSMRNVIPFFLMILVTMLVWHREYRLYFHKYPEWKPLAELYGFQVDVTTIARISQELIETNPDVRVWAMYAGGDPFSYIFSGHERLRILSTNRIPNTDSEYPAVLLLPANERRMIEMLENAFPNAEITHIPYSLNPDIPLVIKMDIEPHKNGKLVEQ